MTKDQNFEIEQLRTCHLKELLKVYEDKQCNSILFTEQNEEYDADKKPYDTMHLNVGGTKVVTLRRTLTSVPGSMLASRFSGRWDESIEKDRDGNFFIDQPYDLFEAMLDYLRNKSNGTNVFSMQSPVFDNPRKQTDFYRMLNYYGMLHGIYPTHLEIRYGSDSNVEVLSPWKVNAKEWTSFKLVQDGHSRQIKTYEVVLGSIQRIQIGWENAYYRERIDFGEGTGVGRLPHTNAIDLVSSENCDCGNISHITPKTEYKAGTTVRVEDFGKRWYVNGDPILNWQMWIETKRSFIPVISVQGGFEVTDIVFE